MSEPTLLLPPARRRWGRVVAFTIGLLLLACCVASVTAGVVGGWLKQASTTATPTPLPGTGAAVRDGQFEFVVSGFECGRTELVNGLLRAKAQGQYCVVDLTVTNIGRDARQFADGNQKAYGPNGTRYAVDTGAGVVANGSGSSVWTTINPGNSISGKVVFDIPPTGSISIVELHDSGLSAGVRVALRPIGSA